MSFLRNVIDEIESKASIVFRKDGAYVAKSTRSATDYTLYLFPVKNFGGYSVGYTEDGYLVVNRPERMCFVFDDKMAPGPGYIHEKLFPRDWEWTTDVNNVWALLLWALRQLKDFKGGIIALE